MMCEIEEGRVCPYKELLYRTAVVDDLLERRMRDSGSPVVLEAGTLVEVQFAWHSIDGEAVFYIGLSRSAWLGIAAGNGLRDFCL